jgi:hypothetical protein
MAPVQGYAAQLGIHTADPVTARFEFLSSTLKKQETFAYGEGVRGSRSRFSYRAREVRQDISGDIVMNPSVTEIDLLLPWIMGGTTSGGVTDLANALTGRFVCIDKVQKVYTYAGCYVNRCVIEGSPGQPLVWTLSLVGQTETEGNSGTFPTLSIPTDNFFVFSGITLTLNSVAYQPERFRLTIDNMLDGDRFLNSLTRTAIVPKDRIVTLETSLMFGDSNALYDVAVTGYAGSLAITDGTTTYTIAFGNLKAPAVGVDIPGRDELKLPLAYQSFHNGTNSECKFTKV